MKIATWNIHHGTRGGEIVQEILRLQRNGCSVFCLQEVHDVTGGRYIGDVIQHSLGSHWRAEFYRGEYHSLGLAILWDAEACDLISVRRTVLPLLERQNWLERTWAGCRKEERGALICTLQIGNKTLRVTSTHLDWQGGYPQRLRQLKHLVRQVRTSGHADAEVLCGDMNTCAPSWMYRRYQKRIYPILDEYKDAFPCLAWSCSTDVINHEDGPFARPLSLLHVCGIHFRQRLDHIFYRNLLLNTAYRENVSCSDHRPLVAEFDLG